MPRRLRAAIEQAEAAGSAVEDAAGRTGNAADWMSVILSELAGDGLRFGLQIGQRRLPVRITLDVGD